MIHGCYTGVRWPARQGGAALVVGLILLVVITLVGVGAMQSTTLQEKMAGNLRDSNLSFQAAEVALRNCENILVQDWDAQVALYNTSAANGPPQARPLNVAWQRRDPTTGLPVNPAVSVWIWSLDEDQAGFPADPRLDPPLAHGNNRPWWAETARNDAWWQSAASNSQVLANNTLDGLFNNQQPRCILEAYIYAAGDNSQTADAFQRARFAEGVVIKNEKAFRLERNFYRITSRGQGGSQTALSLLQAGDYQMYYVQNP
ncbi:MAG: PilX N-terminal domain-containing pilus assembly protein [Candidatus Contendobacter sp.]